MHQCLASKIFLYKVERLSLSVDIIIDIELYTLMEIHVKNQLQNCLLFWISKNRKFQIVLLWEFFFIFSRWNIPWKTCSLIVDKLACYQQAPFSAFDNQEYRLRFELVGTTSLCKFTCAFMHFKARGNKFIICFALSCI